MGVEGAGCGVDFLGEGGHCFGGMVGGLDGCGGWGCLRGLFGRMGWDG